MAAKQMVDWRLRGFGEFAEKVVTIFLDPGFIIIL
jgi:hypothetical protein